MYMMYLLTNDDRRQQIGEVASFDEATNTIKELDQSYEEWITAGKPQDPFPPVLVDWDGCDVYLEDEEGKTWMITYFGWQDYNEFKQNDGRGLG